MIKVLKKPLSLRQIKKQSKNGQEYISGVVSADVGEMTSNCFETFLDGLSMSLTNTELLMDITFEVVGGKGSSVYFKVTGDVSQILESAS